jgi:hypothetical protein
LAYSHDQNGDGTFDRLKVARWTRIIVGNIKTIESGNGYGEHISVATDPLTGQPAIAHSAAGQIHFWRCTGSRWSVEIPDDDAASSTQTAARLRRRRNVLAFLFVFLGR